MDLISGVLAIAGAALVLLAGIGVVRFPDLYSRMHAATKAATLGFLLVATSALFELDANRPKLALAVVVIFLTAPVAAHLLGRSAYGAPAVTLVLDGHDDLEQVLAEATDDTTDD